MKQITVEVLAALPITTVVDVRESDEYRAAHAVVAA